MFHNDDESNENMTVEYVQEDPREITAQIAMSYVDGFMALSSRIAHAAVDAPHEPAMRAIQDNALRMLDVLTERFVLDVGSAEIKKGGAVNPTQSSKSRH